MQRLWETELTEEQANNLIDLAAKKILERGLTTPAIFALESCKPMCGLATQMATLHMPFLLPLVGFDNFNGYSQLLSKREHVERLIQRIEDGGRQEPSEPKPGFFARFRNKRKNSGANDVLTSMEGRSGA